MSSVTSVNSVLWVTAGIMIVVVSLVLLLGVLMGKVQQGPAILCIVGLMGVTAVVVYLIPLADTVPPATSRQLENLETVRNSITDLTTFIDQQQQQLKEADQTLRTLKEEQNRLSPIVNANRAVVEAVLAAHERHAQQGVWKERLIGFVLGIVSSIFATLALNFIESRRGKKRFRDEAPASSI